MIYRRITCVEECSTSNWQLQSSGYSSALDAKLAAARVVTIKHGSMVKLHEGTWAVYFYQREGAHA